MNDNTKYSYYLARYVLRKIVDKLDIFVQEKIYNGCKITLFTLFNVIGIRYELYSPKYDYPLVSNDILKVDYKKSSIIILRNGNMMLIPCTKENIINLIENAKEELLKEDLVTMAY